MDEHKSSLLNEAKIDYQDGKYRDVLTKLAPLRFKDLDDYCKSIFVCSLCRIGALDEAETLLNSLRRTWSEDAACREHLCASIFFLSVAYVRRSQYAVARSNLVDLARLIKSWPPEPIQLFYLRQGLSFYRYFVGHYTLAVAQAKRALRDATLANFVYGSYLANELLAHASIQSGQVSLGFEHFDQAMRYGQVVGSQRIVQNIRIFKAIYSAQFGLVPSKIGIAVLNECLEIEHHDIYSRSAVLLELARQLLLAGELSKVDACLAEVCQLVLKSSNRRHTVMMNLRYAHYYYLQGDFQKAQIALRHGRKAADPRYDRQLLREVEGLAKKVSRWSPELDAPPIGLLGTALLSAGTLESDRDARRALSRGVDERILLREKGQEFTEIAAIGDDPLGDLIDKLHSQKDGLARLIEVSYFGLIYDALKIPPGRNLIIFDIIPGFVAFLSKDAIAIKKLHLAKSERCIAALIANKGPISKQALVEEYWGYRYAAKRHDLLVYPIVSKVRKLLGDKADWLQRDSEGSYEFSVPLHVFDFQRDLPMNLAAWLMAKAGESEAETNSPQSTQSIRERVISKQTDQSINGRQLGLLQNLDQDFIDVRSYMELKGVSRATATRDLSNLAKKGLLSRSGKGKYIKYHLLGKEKEMPYEKIVDFRFMASEFHG